MSKELFELRATSSRSRKFQYGWKLFKNTWETTDCFKFWIKLLQIEHLMCIITNICKMLIMSKRAISCNHHRWCHTVLYHALPSLGEYTAILLILKVLMLNNLFTIIMTLISGLPLKCAIITCTLHVPPLRMACQKAFYRRRRYD